MDDEIALIIIRKKRWKLTSKRIVVTCLAFGELEIWKVISYKLKVYD